MKYVGKYLYLDLIFRIYAARELVLPGRDGGNPGGR
jgi:hypothetical protein|tara:strand:- start:8 stop:115 length:108 start_codon:yes stop_codon:yes gene_type:complete